MPIAFQIIAQLLNYLILAAGGTGQRFGCNKLLYLLNGKTVLEHLLEAWVSILPLIGPTKVCMVCHSDNIEEFKAVSEKVQNRGFIELFVSGGDTRFESVIRGLQAISDSIDNEDIVLVHDAARPFVTAETVSDLINKFDEYDAVCPAISPQETVRLLPEDTLETFPREKVYLMQTPQVFKAKHIPLFRPELAQTANITDELSVFEAHGLKIGLTAGNRNNIKITYPEDIPAATAILKNKQPNRKP